MTKFLGAWAMFLIVLGVTAVLGVLVGAWVFVELVGKR